MIRGELEVQVEQRHVERRDALRVFEIRIGAGRDQVPRALDAALASGIEQGGEAALVHVLGTRLGDDLALPLTDDAARVEVGALRRQELDHLGLALRGRPHQRRLPAPVFPGVDVGARLEQPPGRVDVAAAGDGHQRRLTFRIPGIGIGARLEQRVDDRRRADDRRLGQRRRAELVLQLDVRAGLDQRADQLEIVVRRRPHDGRGPVGPGRIRVGALGQQPQRGRAIATLGRLEQRGSAAARSRRSHDRDDDSTRLQHEAG